MAIPRRSNDTQPAVDAALEFVAVHPSPICLPPIEDLIGVEEQPNLAGNDRRASELATAIDRGRGRAAR